MLLAEATLYAMTLQLHDEEAHHETDRDIRRDRRSPLLCRFASSRRRVVLTQIQTATASAYGTSASAYGATAFPLAAVHP